MDYQLARFLHLAAMPAWFGSMGLFDSRVLVGVQATYFRTLDALLVDTTDPVAPGRLRWLVRAFHALWSASLALMVFQKVIV